jgi:hypothetical protein
MEREQEIKKLTTVLQRIARSASYATWSNTAADAALFCVKQYNAVLARLTELEPQVAYAFTQLPETASPQVTRIAARELGAYFEGEGESGEEREGHHRQRRSGCWSARRTRHGWAAYGRW